MTIQYVFPFDHQPTVAEMAGHNLLVVDIRDLDEAILVHNLNMPPGIDPIVGIIPLSNSGSFALPQVEFSGPNQLVLASDRAVGALALRFYIQRITLPLL